MDKKKNQLMPAIAAALSVVLCLTILMRIFLPDKIRGLLKKHTEAGNTAAVEESTQLPEVTAVPASPTPEVTLPIILSNAPTPTPTASPTPTPSPTPEPSPTPVPDIAYGTVNRQSNLRSEASKKGSVKKQVQKNRMVTIHAAMKDEEGNIWYFLTDDDSGTDGWMRDYLVDIKSGAVTEVGVEATPQTEYLGTGVVNQKANVRKIMNGGIISTLKKGTAVSILETKRDKKGYLWYHIHPDNGTKDGYIKSDLVDLDAPLTESITAESGEISNSESADSAIAGRAVTAQQTNVRETPFQKGKVVRQLSEGIELQILGMFENDGAKWYLVQTPSGRTRGYARAYTLKIVEMKTELTPAPYTP